MADLGFQKGDIFGSSISLFCYKKGAVHILMYWKLSMSTTVFHQAPFGRVGAGNAYILHLEHFYFFHK